METIVVKEDAAVKLVKGTAEMGVATGADNEVLEGEGGLEDEGAGEEESPVPGAGVSPTLTRPDFSVISEGQEAVSHSTLLFI